MIKEIGSEIIYVLTILIVIMWGLMFCDIYCKDVAQKDKCRVYTTAMEDVCLMTRK